MLLLLLACADRVAPAPPLPPPAEPALVRVDDGPLASRVTGGDGAGLVLLYTGELGGELGPCGCDDRPRGGLARVAAYQREAIAADPSVPMLLVDGGAWLGDPRTWKAEERPDVLITNRWMAEGQRALATAALNVSRVDLPGLAALGDSAASLPLVSANVRAVGHEALDIQPWRVVERQGLRVGITGLTEAPEEPIAGFEVRDPYAAGREALRALAPQTDIIVLLAWHSPAPAARLARELPVDVVVDTFHHSALYEPFREGHAIWVRSQDQTTRLGELRLGLEAGAVTWALERKIDLGPDMPDDPAMAELIRRAEDEIDRVVRQRR